MLQRSGTGIVYADGSTTGQSMFVFLSRKDQILCSLSHSSCILRFRKRPAACISSVTRVRTGASFVVNSRWFIVFFRRWEMTLHIWHSRCMKLYFPGKFIWKKNNQRWCRTGKAPCGHPHVVPTTVITQTSVWFLCTCHCSDCPTSALSFFF